MTDLPPYEPPDGALFNMACGEHGKQDEWYCPECATDLRKVIQELTRERDHWRTLFGSR